MLQTKATQQDNAEVEVARCSKGQYFGELALVTNKPRAASVYAVGDTKCIGMLQMMVWFPLFTSRGDSESIFHAEHSHLASSKHNKSSVLPTATTLQVYMLYVALSCSSQDSFDPETVLKFNANRNVLVFLEVHL